MTIVNLSHSMFMVISLGAVRIMIHTRYTNIHGIVKGQTCYVIHRVETNSKLSDFERIFSLYTLLHILHTLPVFILEHCIVV